MNSLPIVNFVSDDLRGDLVWIIQSLPFLMNIRVGLNPEEANFRSTKPIPASFKYSSKPSLPFCCVYI